MNGTTDSQGEREERLGGILLAYLEAVEAGQEPANRSCWPGTLNSPRS
jgi:hypothetical protein